MRWSTLFYSKEQILPRRLPLPGKPVGSVYDRMIWKGGKHSEGEPHPQHSPLRLLQGPVRRGSLRISGTSDWNWGRGRGGDASSSVSDLLFCDLPEGSQF